MPENPDARPPRVVLMCGVSGSGKTHYARQLEAAGFMRLSPDSLLWERIGPSLPTLPPERQRKLFAEAATEIADSLKRAIDEKRDVVVDPTMCRRAKRDEMRHLCLSKGITPQLIYMDAPLQLLKQRMATRCGLGPDDQTVDDRLLETYFSNFERPQPDEDFTTIVQTL